MYEKLDKNEWKTKQKMYEGVDRKCMKEQI